jgi:hypothetical protein
MTIRTLRILPPLAIGRLGGADEPVDNYTLEPDPEEPLGFRRICPADTLVLDPATGEIRERRRPETIEFKRGGRFRPVAPFLELYAETDGATLVPVTLDLLRAEGLGLDAVEWRVEVANRKIVRRTNDDRDLVSADTDWFSGHDPRELRGHCPNFIAADRYVSFGQARFVRPNAGFPELRFRFTPARGLIYGPQVIPADDLIPAERAIYRSTGRWYKYGEEKKNDGGAPEPWRNETLPPALFAIIPPAPSWLHNNKAVSRGYFDDACDGFVQVRIRRAGNPDALTAAARISSGPPAVVPDSFFVRCLADDLDQVLYGPAVPANEPYQVTLERAADIIRRAYETVRFLNVLVLNGNDYLGRNALLLDSMPEEEAADTQRAIRPVMAADSVDTLAIMALHQQVLAALRGGAAPWFVDLLRKPEEVGDFTDYCRRKMPALMCGADNGYLALTRRQIDTVARVAARRGFDPPEPAAPVPDEGLTPRNVSAQLYHKAAGNPVSSRPESAIANCCPGLELDFRAVWRRLFEGVVLREYDNLVVDIDPKVEAARDLKGHRLLRVAGVPVTTELRGPAASDVGGSILLTTDVNPYGIARMEWSNALATVLWTRKEQLVECDFSREESWDQQLPFDAEAKNYVTVKLKVRSFFEPASALISRALADAGELTQGLCSPWQNDYRECSCYYWASARPDFVNVEPTAAGTSGGDNWFQKRSTGQYVADDYEDERLVLYDDLFRDWERWLRVVIGGRDIREPGKESGR